MNFKARLQKLLNEIRDPTLAPALNAALIGNSWSLYRIPTNTSCSICSCAITRGDVVWIRISQGQFAKRDIRALSCEILHNMSPCKNAADSEIDQRVTEIVNNWACDDTEKSEAALAVARLGGFGSLVDFTESE